LPSSTSWVYSSSKACSSWSPPMGSSDEIGTISTHKHIQQTINKQYTKE
jgi:hypothetical protein